MDTHDEQNKAGPQKESSSVFRGGPISQDDTRSNDQTHDNQSSDPYRFAQSLNKENTEEQTGTTVYGPGKVTELWQQIKRRVLPENAGVGDTKQKVMVILIPVLFIIMIFMFRQVLSKSPKKTKASTNDNIQANVAKTDNEIDWQIPEQIPVDLRDPIKPSSRITTSTINQTDSNAISNLDMLSVRGIIYSHDKPSAVIGDRIVHLNDKIDNATVVEIERDYVIFEKDGKRWMKKVAEMEIEQQEQLWQEQQQRDIEKIRG